MPVPGRDAWAYLSPLVQAMRNIDELLQELQQEDEWSEDRTIYVRETPHGTRVDFESIERTSFQKAYPETTRRLVTQQALPCGHPVTKDNPFGGYCQGRSLVGMRRCNNEYCASCAVQCTRCGVFVSARCCARPLNDALYCRSCRNLIVARRLVFGLLRALVHPFTVAYPDE